MCFFSYKFNYKKDSCFENKTLTAGMAATPVARYIFSEHKTFVTNLIAIPVVYYAFPKICSFYDRFFKKDEQPSLNKTENRTISTDESRELCSEAEIEDITRLLVKQ